MGEEVTETTHVHLFALVSSRAATFCVMDNNAASPDFLSTFSYQGSIEDQPYANVQTKTYLTESAVPSVYSVQKFLERILHIGRFSLIPHHSQSLPCSVASRRERSNRSGPLRFALGDGLLKVKKYHAARPADSRTPNCIYLLVTRWHTMQFAGFRSVIGTMLVGMGTRTRSHLSFICLVVWVTPVRRWRCTGRSF